MNVIHHDEPVCMKLKETKLQIIEFGDRPEDRYFCLIDLNVSPDGMDLEKLRLADPRNFDLEFRASGCLLMLTGDEISELVSRGELREDDLHSSLFDLAVKEGIIQEK